MFCNLEAIKEDRVWVEYIYSRSIVNKKIDSEEKEQMIKESVECGKEYARKIRVEFENKSISDIAEKLRLRVELNDGETMKERILFAQFHPPDKVHIMSEPLLKYEDILNASFYKDRLPTKEEIYNCILAHEMFHYIEERDKTTIYTQTKRISLFRVGKLSYKTPISALGEIAAMSFSKELNNLSYSPFVIDVLLSYYFDKKVASEIYKDILFFKKSNH